MGVMTWKPGKMADPIFWLSAVSATCLVVLTLTGIILALWYEPSPDLAYNSMLYIGDNVHFGPTLLSVHHWATHLLILSILLHLLRVFFMGTYKKAMRWAWVTGSIFLVVTILFVFSGYLLRYDEVGYWSIKVTASIVGYTPLIGEGLESFILGGDTITSRTLSRFYLWHIGVLPLLTLFFLGYHYLLVKKRTVSWAEVGVGFVATGFLLLYSGVQPFLLTPRVTPELTSILKPIWPFLWLYVIERSLPPSLNFLNILILLTVAGGILTLPFIDHKEESAGWKRKRNMLGLGFIALFIFMSALGYLF